MRFSISVILLGVAGLTTALPVANVQDVEARQAPQEAVLIDYYVQNGVTVATSTLTYLVNSEPTPTPDAAAAAPPPPTPAPVTNQGANTKTGTDNSPAAAGSDPGDGSPGAPGGVSGGTSGAPFKSGVTYSQFMADNSCRSAAAVKTDVQALINNGHDLIRIYGVECNGPQNLLNAIKGSNVKMFLGLYNLDTAAADAQSLATQLGNDWSQVHTVSVGNEVVNSVLGQSDADQQAAVQKVLGAMSSAKATLKAAGYQGPVVNVDTMVAIEKYPTLCQSSDYCAMNCHAFFDGGKTGQQAGPFVDMFVQKIKQVTGMDKVVVTETGWPRCGTSKGVALAVPNQQQAALASLKAVTSADLILFSGYNEYWKVDTTGTEHCWGMYGDSPGGR